MSSKRVHYREYQTLTYGELSDDQAYRITMRRRHNLAHHGWGIVQGLVLRPTPTGVNLSPGFAVDGYGRELIVPRVLRLGHGEFAEVLGARTVGYVDVWLTYQLVMPARPGEYCYEDAWVRLDCCDDPDTLVDPRRPPEVPTSFDSSTEQTLPDDPEQEWPVYLGRIAVGVGESGAPPYRIELTERPYASLVGASLQTPTGKRWMQIGDEEAGDNRRFAISLPDEQGKGVDRLLLGRDGDSTLRGKLRLSAAGTSSLMGDGDLALLGAAPESGRQTGIELDTLASTPETALPWQLYRTAVEIEQGQQTLEVDQLRFETFHPGEEGDPARAKLAIGEPHAAFRDLATVQGSQELNVAAVGGGAWGNRVFVRVTRTTFHLTLLYYRELPPVPFVDPTDPANKSDPNRREPDLVEDFHALGVDPNGDRYCITTVNDASQLVALRLSDEISPPALPTIPVEFTPLEYHLDLDTVEASQALVVAAKGERSNRVFVRVAPGSTDATFNLTLLYYRELPPLPLVDPTDPANKSDPNRREPDLVEDFLALGVDPEGDRYCITTVNDASQLVALRLSDEISPPALPTIPVEFTPLEYHLDLDTVEASQALVVAAKGERGNRVFVRVAPTFDLTLSYYREPPPLPLVDPRNPAKESDPNCREPDLIEDFHDLGVTPFGPRNCIATVNGASQLVALRWKDERLPPALPKIPVEFTPLEQGNDHTFAPQLTVRSDGTVVIEGNLLIEGQLIEGAIPADIEDERFRDQLLERWTKALTLAGTEVDAFYELPLKVTVAKKPPPGPGQVGYTVTIEHNGGSDSREVPILAIIGEFRNKDRVLIRPESLTPDPSENPIRRGRSMTVGSTTNLGVTGAISLTVRVVALGAAQNRVEKTAHAVFNL